jgi:glycosyltransferase involved in cell wall biosynthesis
MSLRLTFIVESGTDVRLVEGLAERFELRLFARAVPGAATVSWPPRRPVEVKVGPSSRAAFAMAVRRRLQEWESDFVLAQGYGPAALAANFVARQRKIPAAMLICSPVEEYYRCRLLDRDPVRPFRRRELAALAGVARLNARIGQRYIVLSDHLARTVRRHGAKRVDVIPLYGVNREIFRPSSENRNEVRSRLGLPPGRMIFFSSRVAPEKDAATLMRAFAQLRSEGADVWLLHRSGGWRAVEALAKENGVRDRVVATDAVPPFEKLADDYRASDVCVQASRAEGLGFSVLESLACGTPVVAAQTGGLRETIRDGETGWTYPVGDSHLLAAAIREVLADPAEAQRRTARGAEMVREHFDREMVFGQLHALILAAARTDRA